MSDNQRYPRTACFAGRYVFIGLLLFSLLAVIGLLVSAPALRQSLLVQTWMDVGHFPLFLCWQLLLAGVLRTLGWRRGHWIAAVVLLLLAALVEWVQGAVGRDVSLRDWLIGAVGVGNGLALGYWRKGVSWQRAGLVLLVLVSAGWASHWALKVSAQVWQDRQQFPQLLALQPGRVPPFWWALPTGVRPTAQLHTAPCDQRQCLVVTTLPGAYSGVSRQFENSDWRGYRALLIEVRSASALQLHVRIDDQRPAPPMLERFNTELAFPGGQHSLRIPLQGEQGVGGIIDLATVQRLAIFVSPQDQPVSFRLLRVTLE